MKRLFTVLHWFKCNILLTDKMTSTPFNIGIAEDRRPASRVLCPPGGQHADIFGNVPSPPRYSRRQAFQVQGIDNVL